jgi:predicted regulator of Ras-like GTPase activity (Roadblock/LC7/MglB family)
MARVDDITRALKLLSTNTPDVEAAALIDNDGLMIASAMSQDLDDDSVAAMSAALLGLSERITRELSRGNFELVMLRGSEGYSVLVRCGPDAVLTALATKGAKLGLIFLDIQRSAKEIARLLG